MAGIGGRDLSIPEFERGRYHA